jgi:ABC-type Na+ transport system ATPase subunit NatA
MALRNVSFSIDEGEHIAILGPNWLRRRVRMWRSIRPD